MRIESWPPGLLESKAAYEELLRGAPDVRTDNAWRTLRGPLTDLWATRYIEHMPHEPDLQAFTARGIEYVFDKAGYNREDVESRVVGVVAVSQELLSLPALLRRLEATGTSGEAREATLGLIDATFAAVMDALPRRRHQALRDAARQALDEAGLTVIDIVEDATRHLQYAHRVPAVTQRIDKLYAALREYVSTAGSEETTPKVTERELEPLRNAARRARHALTDESQLRKELLGTIPDPLSYLQERLAQAPTDTALERTEHHLGRFIDAQEPRPRSARQQRHNALHLKARCIGRPLDVGHFAAHASGGNSDMNLFPQDRALNRGWSDEGKEYRRLERFIATHAGTFYFSRPVYTDATIVPRYLEVGVLLPGRAGEVLASSSSTRISAHQELELLLSVFDNQPKDDGTTHEPAAGTRACSCAKRSGGRARNS